MLQHHRQTIKNPDVVKLIEDPTFWADMAKLQKVVAPFSKVIMAVQANDSTLADTCRWASMHTACVCSCEFVVELIGAVERKGAT